MDGRQPRIRTFAHTGIVAALTLVAACGQDEAEPAMDDMDMPGMSAPGGGGAAMGSGAMMENMGAHMQRMASMRGDSLAQALPMHRQMVANMLAQMNREMAEMEMPADTAWNATVDSLRSDLTQMPGMGPDALEAFMPAHHERMARLMSMHDEMMRRMGM